MWTPHQEGSKKQNMTGTSRGQAPSWKTEQSSWPLLKLMRETSKRYTTAILWNERDQEEIHHHCHSLEEKFKLIMITTLMRETSKRYNTHILWRKKAFICYCTFLRQVSWKLPIHLNFYNTFFASQIKRDKPCALSNWRLVCQIRDKLLRQLSYCETYLSTLKSNIKIFMKAWCPAGKGGFLTSLSLPYSRQGQPWN